MKIADESIYEFLNNIATKTQTPAGGCIAALCADSAAALMEMVARHTLNNKDKSIDTIHYMEEVVQIASTSRKNFLDYMDVDVKAYKDVINAQKGNKINIEEYYKKSVNIPLKMAQKIPDMIDMIKKTTKEGSQVLVTDGIAALFMTRCTLNSLIYHIKFNLMYIKDKDFIEDITAKLQIIEQRLD